MKEIPHPTIQNKWYLTLKVTTDQIIYQVNNHYLQLYRIVSLADTGGWNHVLLLRLNDPRRRP